MKRLSSRQLLESVHNGSLTSAKDSSLYPLTNSGRPALLDVRSTQAYMGWALKGEKQGGHIPGAQNMPLYWWTRDVSPVVKEELDANWSTALTDRGVVKDNQIILYGDSETDAEQVARVLVDDFSFSPSNIGILDGGFKGWDGLVNWLPRYEWFVYPEWVKELQDSGKPHKLFHVNYDKPEEYAETHLPNAFHLNTILLEDPKDWNRRSPEELEAALQKYGISKDTLVVLYGRTTKTPSQEKLKGRPGANAGQIAAYRAKMILTYAGVKDVRVLDGGYDLWTSKGYPVTTEEFVPEPLSGNSGLSIPENPRVIVDLEEAKQLLADPKGELLSIRAFKEFIGQKSGYNYLDFAGDIAGARFGDCGSDAYHMETWRNPDNRTMLSFPRVEAILERMQCSKEKRVGHYCGTGWRASESWAYSYALGHDNAAVYDGGWMEWSSDPTNPVSKEHPELTEQKKHELWGMRAPADTVVKDLKVNSKV